MITVTDLYKKFGTNTVLKGINWDVPKHSVTAIIGPSGAGKTTLMRLVNLLDEPTSGTVFFDGVDASASEKVRLEMRRRMGIVFQKPVVFSSSVYENVAYGLKIRGETLQNVRERVSHALETVDLSDYASRKAATLSGGEVQRVALARAMVIEPELLLLDEPTANLDPASTARVESLISRVIQELHTTVILTTHDMGQGQRLADRAVVLEQGRIVSQGPALDVLNRPTHPTVARLAGVENVYDAMVTRLSQAEGTMVCTIGPAEFVAGLADVAKGDMVRLGIRAGDVLIASEAPRGLSAQNVIESTIVGLEQVGRYILLTLDCGVPLIASITLKAVEDLGLAEGSRVWAVVKATSCFILRE